MGLMKALETLNTYLRYVSNDSDKKEREALKAFNDLDKAFNGLKEEKITECIHKESIQNKFKKDVSEILNHRVWSLQHEDLLTLFKSFIKKLGADNFAKVEKMHKISFSE